MRASTLGRVAMVLAVTILFTIFAGAVYADSPVSNKADVMSPDCPPTGDPIDGSPVGPYYEPYQHPVAGHPVVNPAEEPTSTYVPELDPGYTDYFAGQSAPFVPNQGGVVVKYIDVMDEFVATDVEVMLDITVDYSYQLSIYLISPDGQQTLLAFRPGDGSAADLRSMWITNYASLRSDGCQNPCRGAWLPGIDDEDRMPENVGAAGTWSIAVFYNWNIGQVEDITLRLYH